MNQTIDAKVFFLQPGTGDRERIEKLIEIEACEIFILHNPEIVSKLIAQLDKSILIIDRETFEYHEDLSSYIDSLIDLCGSKLFKVIAVDTTLSLPQRDSVYMIDRERADNDKEILKIIEELGLWGLRKYIRFGSQNSRIAFFRMKFYTEWRTGVIHDISASGMSCSFDRFVDIDVSDKSSVIEICIKETIFRFKGNFLIRRTFKNSNMFVLVFSRKRGRGGMKNLNSIIYKLTREQVLDKIEKLV